MPTRKLHRSTPQGNTTPGAPKKTIASKKTKNTKTSKRTRGWCFTSFEKEAPDFDEVVMEYMVYGKEKCPETKKKHWQGFVYYINPKTMSAAKKYLGDTVHMEPMRGTLKEAIAYCKKDGKWKEFGKEPTQGSRTDLDEIAQKIVEGKISDVCDLADTMPAKYNLYHRTFKQIEDNRLRRKQRTTAPKAYWFWGSTGTGKSHKAAELAEGKTSYWYKNDNGWWDDYKQQDVVIINDFRGEIAYNELLQMCDKWPYSVKRRNRPPVNFTSDIVVITSSLPPDKIYHNRNSEDKIEQLTRRMEIICTNTKNNTKKTARAR